MHLRGRALLGEDLSGILRGFIDEEPHLRARRLEVRSDTVVHEFLSGCRADGEDGDRCETAAKIVRQAHLLCDAEEVDDLHGGHEEYDIDVAIDDGEDAFAQRSEVERESPLVDGNLDDGGGADGELCDEIWIGCAVLLHGNAHRSEFVAEGRLDRLQKFAPGAGLECGRGDGDIELAEGGLGLDAADCNFGCAQGGEKVFAIKVRRDDFHHRSDTDAGHEEDQVETSFEEVCGEFEARLVGFERDLAHGGHYEGLTVIGADELCNFPGSSRFVGKNAEPVETGVWHSVLLVGDERQGRQGA